MSFTVAIIGRPNVGKSTLFNSLLRKKSAIVYDYPGVTRDRKEAKVDFLGLKFKLIDTAGYEVIKNQTYGKSLAKQIDLAVSDADLLLLVLDAKTGVIAEDYDFIDYIRKKNKDVLLIVNKSESNQKNLLSHDVHKFGFTETVFLSAEHRIGYDDLFTHINNFYHKYLDIYGEIAQEERDTKTMRVAIVGKPNVGKSTFINSLIGSERLLAADESGTTRDAIEIPWQYKEHPITLIDTAGIRKRAKIQQKLDKLSYEDSLKAIRFSDICILLLDATQTKLERQDLTIISHIISEGRGLVIALNKSDLLSKEALEQAISEVDYQISKYATQNKSIKTYAVSAIKGRHIKNVINITTEIYKNWNIRIPTSQLNDWLNKACAVHSPPLYKGKEVKLKYITQIKSRPPTFVIMSNHPDKILASYLKYLKNSLIEDFDLFGINPRLILKKISNPYDNKKNSFKTIKQ